MKIITMCVWKRPIVLEETLTWMQRADGIKDYHLVIHCDGGNGTEEVLHRVRRINFAHSVEVLRSQVNLGCNESTRRVLHRGFELADYVIHVEEDIVLAPDALRYFEWAKQYKTVDDLWLISAWRHHEGWLPGSGPFPEHEQIEAKAKREAALLIWGWATWRDRWAVMRQHWTTGTDQNLSWDIALERARANLGKNALCPLVSRTVNCGEGGIHRGSCYLDYWSGSPGFQRDDNFNFIDS